MAALKNIKLKIQSVQKTRKVTRAMEAVSAVKMRKAQERAIVARPYAAAAFSVLERISGTADVAQHPLTQAREGKTAVIPSRAWVSGCCATSDVPEMRSRTENAAAA
jgi:F-type H+-transporting ATPase subunit gamma